MKVSAVAAAGTSARTRWAGFISQVSDATKLGYYRTLLPLNVELAQSAAEPSGDPKNWCYTKTSACSLYTYSDYGFQIPDSAYSYKKSTVKGYQDTYVAMAVRPQYDAYCDADREDRNEPDGRGGSVQATSCASPSPFARIMRERLDGYSFDAC